LALVPTNFFLGSTTTRGHHLIDCFSARFNVIPHEGL
jgi:hypothetical protein